MKSNKFVISVVSLLVLGGVVALFFQSGVMGGDKEPLLPFGKITRADAVKHIEWTYSQGGSYKQFALEKNGPREYALAFYQPNNWELEAPIDERRGGILMFKIYDRKPQLLWESQEFITLTRPTIDVRDITGDGNSEILAKWSNGDVDLLYIYSRKNDTFALISPFTTSTTPSGILIHQISFGSLNGDIQVRDLDEDFVEEVILIGPKKVTEQETQELFVVNIYKWNGSSYYQWKRTETDHPWTLDLKSI